MAMMEALTAMQAEARRRSPIVAQGMFRSHAVELLIFDGGFFDAGE
jgi:hypothetical protein